MKTVLLPVKEFSNAKQRLAGILSPDQRAGLARAMFVDVLGAVTTSLSVERAIVITASDEVARIASGHGLEVVIEVQATGHSAAVNQMAGQLVGTASAFLAIASDLPTLRGEDIDQVLDSDCDGIALMASRDGTGTNGVLMRPGATIQMDYGTDSLRRHILLAEASGSAAVVMEIPEFGFDVDTPDDLAHLIEVAPRRGETWESAMSLGVLDALRASR